MAEADAGRLDHDAAAAVLAEAGHARPAAAPTRPAGLSDREVEVLALIAAGCSNAEVAERLFISRRTAEHHAQHIYAKIGVSTRAAAALFAVAARPGAPRIGRSADAPSGGRRGTVLPQRPRRREDRP